MSTLKSNTIEPATATTLSLGAVGDNVTVSADSIQTNLYKDSGGNTLFQSNGSGTLSNVNSGLLGDGPKLITTNTSTSTSLFSFTSDIDSTYDLYMFTMINLQPLTNSTDIELQFSTNAGVGYGVSKTTNLWYAINDEGGGTGSIAINDGMSLDNSTSPQKIAYGVGNTDQTSSGILYLYSPSDTTYIKHWYLTTNFYRADDNSQQFFVGGYCSTGSAINALKIYAQSGNIKGTIKMYGIS